MSIYVNVYVFLGTEISKKDFFDDERIEDYDIDDSTYKDLDVLTCGDDCYIGSLLSTSYDRFPDGARMTIDAWEIEGYSANLFSKFAEYGIDGKVELHVLTQADCC